MHWHASSPLATPLLVFSVLASLFLIPDAALQLAFFMFMKSWKSVGHPGRSFVPPEDEVAQAIGFSLSDEKISRAK